MWGLLVSAFNGLLGSLFKTVAIKFVLFTALTLLIAEIMKAVISLFPTQTDLVSLFEQLPDSAWYFINLAELPFGIQVVFTAIATRFIFGMLPIVGH